ncbi:MAG: hypothetical protein NVSMB46_04930 [Candidatus Saccharimonadales bacterium]
MNNEHYLQGELFPNFVPESNVVKFDSRAAAGRIPKLEFFGLTADVHFNELTQNDIELVTPDALREGLFQEKGPFVYRGLALRPDEYEVFIRNHNSFGKAVVAKTLSARQIDSNVTRRSQAADRSETKAYTSKIEPIEGLISGYENDCSTLLHLQKEFRSPGYAHMNEIDLRLIVGTAKDLIFRNMVTVIGLNNKWNTEVMEKSYHALDYNLLGRSYKENFSNWQSYIAHALLYRDRCLRLAKNNKLLTERAIARSTT